MTTSAGPQHASRMLTEILERRGLTPIADSESREDRERRLAVEAAAELRELRREHAAAYCVKHIPFRWAEAVADNEIVLKWVVQFLTDPRRAPSLLLSGTTGNGKTYQAYGALRAIAAEGVPVQWAATTTAELYATLRPRGRGVDSEAEFNRFASSPLLLLDDLGAAKSSEWTEEVTYRLIDHRYGHCLPSIFTTNLPPRELADGLGDRIASRLIEMTDVVIFEGDDRRRARLNAGAP